MNMFDDSSLSDKRPATTTATFPQGILAQSEDSTAVDKAAHRHRPILVTGSHYAGTTWVGRMLAQASDVGYIHEPFRPQHDQGICAAHFNLPFEYMHDSASDHQAAIEDMLGFKYRLWPAIRTADTFSQLRQVQREYLSFFTHRLASHRALIKDPNALFSAPWLEKTFAMDVVIVIRHPAAFAGSLKASGCRVPFLSFLNQGQLMRDQLTPFDTRLQQYALMQPDIIDEAILLWRMMHLVILRYLHYHPRWIFVRHEDLSRDPLTGFSRLYQALGLDYTARVQRVIEEHSSEHHAATGRNTHTIRRNSMANLHTWSRRLTDSEILRIKEGTEDFAHHFYNELDWLHG